MGVVRVGGCLLSFGVCVCSCMGVYVHLCVSVCLCVWAPGGQVWGNVCGCGEFGACIGGVGVALQKWYEISMKLAGNSYEIRANFVRISFKIRPQNASNVGTINAVVTNFIRNSYEFRILFEQFARTHIIFVQSKHTQPIAHNTATQQQHTRTTRSGHEQQSPMRSGRQTKDNKQQAKKIYQHSRKASITHRSISSNTLVGKHPAMATTIQETLSGSVSLYPLSKSHNFFAKKCYRPPSMAKPAFPRQ